MNLKLTCRRARADKLTICYRKKQIEVSFSCVCPVINNEFRHNIVKVVGVSTATLAMLRRNSLPITGRTHEKLTSNATISSATSQDITSLVNSGFK